MANHLFRLVFLFLFLAFLPTRTCADDASFTGDGVTVFPRNSDSIELESEVINISSHGDLLHSRWYVDVSLVFRNHGPTQALQMGFPYSYDSDGDADWVEEPYFRTWVDGQEIDVTRKIGTKSMSLQELHDGIVYVSTVSFEKNQRRTVRHTYYVGGYGASDGSWQFKYILKTGALWRGNIAKIDVYLALHKCLPSEIQYLTPSGFQAALEARGSKDCNTVVVQWHYSNLKPTFDIVFGAEGSLWQQSIKDGIFNAQSALAPLHELRRKGQPCEAALHMEMLRRYYINLIYAIHGYPFKNPFTHAQFYPDHCQYSPLHLKENPAFNMKLLTSDELALIKWVSGDLSNGQPE